LLLDEVHRREAHLRGGLAEVGQRDLAVAPAAERLLEAAVLHDALPGGAPGGRSERGSGEGRPRGGEGLAAADLGHGAPLLSPTGSVVRLSLSRPRAAVKEP